MKTKMFLFVVIVVAVLLAGCAQIGGAETRAVLEATEGTEVLSSENFGYTFLYPDNYTVVTLDSGDNLVIDSIMNHVDPRLGIDVEDAAGRTAAEAADALLAEYPEGFVIGRSTITLDGAEAVVLDQVPGQDMNRFVFVVKGDRLYRLMFTHAAPDEGETFTRMENLYTVVTNSFRFLDE